MFRAAMSEDIDRIENRLDTQTKTVEALAATVETHDTTVSSLEKQMQSLLQKAPEVVWPRPAAAAVGSAASTTGSSASCAPPAAFDASGSRGPGWQPRLLYIRGWSPYGSAANTRIGREEVELLDTKVRAALGDAAAALDLLPPFAANHQLQYRVRGADIFEVKRGLVEALRRHDVQARGCSLRVVLEQSADRKRDYGLYARARDRLFSDSAISREHIAECERGLKLYSKGTWELLGHPTVSGWRWLPEAFVAASLPLPSFLVGDAGGAPQHGEKRRLEDGGGDRQLVDGEEQAAAAATTAADADMDQDAEAGVQSS